MVGFLCFPKFFEKLSVKWSSGYMAYVLRLACLVLFIANRPVFPNPNTSITHHSLKYSKFEL